MVEKADAKVLADSPDTVYYLEFGEWRVGPDEDHIIGLMVNWVLCAVRSRLRARTVMYMDAVRAWGIVDNQQGLEMADRMQIDPETKTYADPNEGRLARSIKRKLGLVNG